MRHAIARALFRVGKALSEKAWQEQTALKANRASVVVMMATLDRMSIAHCSDCAQTQGLGYFAGRPYCREHFPVSLAEYCIGDLKLQED